jgi:hypothetical protein
MKKNILILLTTILTVTAKAQTPLVATDSSITYINNEGLIIKLGKADGNKFSIITTVQTGFQTNKLDSVNSNRLSLNLVRAAFTASLLKDKVSMSLVTDFNGTTPILEGWISVAVMNKKGRLYIGQKQAHTNNRLAMADERFAHNMGQSIAGKSNDGVVYGGLMQNFVGATREGGVFLETNYTMGNWKVYPSVSITTGEGQNFFNAETNVGFKYGGRIDVLPMGDFIKNNAFIAEDIYREPKLKLAIGVAASYNAKASSPIGSDNGIITKIYGNDGKNAFADYRKIVADLMLKVQGFSFITEFVNTSVQGKELYTNIAATNQLTPLAASSFYNIGTAYNVQTAYVSTKGWSVGGRFSSIQPEFFNTTSLVAKQQWYTFSLNKFMKNNAVKAGVNFTYLTNNNSVITSNSWMSNIAIQLSL